MSRHGKQYQDVSHPYTCSTFDLEDAQVTSSTCSEPGARLRAYTLTPQSKNVGKTRLEECMPKGTTHSNFERRLRCSIRPGSLQNRVGPLGRITRLLCRRAKYRAAIPDE